MLTLAFGMLEPEPEPSGTWRFGDYQIEGKIARGGMGVVYRARQVSLKRPVAIKMIVGGELADQEAVQRFHLEAEAAARLRHPNIVSIYDVGIWEHEHYFAMELVTGGSLADRRERSARQTAALIAKVARALAFAHDHGVLHRDIKPSNILLDSQEEPRLSDFGLAKLLTHDHGLTISSTLLGSPSYMAPEQATLGEVTTAADIYGIGAVLYDLLAGHAPFLGATAVETLRLVVDASPQPLPPSVPRDLATICAKCMEKDPQARYASARDLAEDLERFGRGEAISARPVSQAELLVRWVRRRPKTAAMVATTILAIFTGISGVFWQWRKAEQASAEQAKTLKHLHWKQIGDWLDQGNSAQALAYLAARIRERPDNWQAAMYAMSIVDYSSFPIAVGAEINPAVKLTQQACLSPTGEWIAAPATDRSVRVWQASSGQQIRRITFDSPVTAVVAGNKYHELTVALQDGRLLLFRSLTDEAELIPRPDLWPISGLAYSTNGSRLLAWGSQHAEMHGECSHAWTQAGGISGAALSPNGECVLLWNRQSAVVYDSISGDEVFKADALNGFINGTISTNGQRVTLIDDDRGVRTFDVSTQTAYNAISRKGQNWRQAALNHEGTRVTLSGANNDLFVYDVESAICVSPPMAHNFYVQSILASADGTRIASLSLDNTARVWEADTGLPIISSLWTGGWNRSGSLSMSDNGHILLVHSKPKGPLPDSLITWQGSPVRTASRRKFPSTEGLGGSGMSADGTLVCLAPSSPFRCQVFELESGKTILDSPTNGEVYVPLISPDKQYCYAFTGNGWLHGWSLATGRELWPPRKQSGSIRPAAITPDGQCLVAGHNDGHIRVYDPRTGEVVRTLEHPGEIKTLRFAPGSSSRLFSGGTDQLAHLWDLQTGAKLQTFKGHSDTILSSAWSPDGKTVATASYDTTVRMWDVASGEPHGKLMFHAGGLSHLEFSPDGRILGTISRDGTARMWDARTGDPLIDPITQGQSGEIIRFTADGAAFLLRDLNGFRFYDGQTGEPITRYFTEPLRSGIGMDCESWRAIMNRDGTRVFLGYSMDDAALWRIEQPRTRTPAWFPDLLEALAFMRLDKKEVPTKVPASQWLRIKEEIMQSPVDDCYTCWARQLLDDHH